MPERPRAVVLDIEGTTTPIAFVHQTLFPFARARLPSFLRDHADDPAVQAELQAVPGPDPAATLLRWIDEDVKATPLKTLQGLIWREGYADGSLRGVVYPDVAAALRRWHGAGLTLFVYSSGSVEAQRLIFGHSTAGDLSALFAGFFDTRTGPKREAESYRAIAAASGLPAGTMLFLSDMEPELDAAAAAGLQTCQLVRAGDGTLASSRHPTAADLDAVDALIASPARVGGER